MIFAPSIVTPAIRPAWPQVATTRGFCRVALVRAAIGAEIGSHRRGTRATLETLGLAEGLERLGRVEEVGLREALRTDLQPERAAGDVVVADGLATFEHGAIAALATDAQTGLR